MIPVSIFIQILNMSLGAAWAALLVMAFRLLLRRFPHSYSYALWGVVLFRLVCPASLFSSSISLMPRPQTIPQNIIYAQRPQVESGFVWFDQTVSSALPPATPYASANPVQIWLEIGNLLWQAGVVVLLLYFVLSYLLFLRRLRGAVRGEGQGRVSVWESDRVPTAFVLGIFRPKIYLPIGVGEAERKYILCHEQTHIRRLDHIVKPLALLLLALHWFNPVLWLAWFLMFRDMEMSCDELALKKLGTESRKAYSSCLLALSARGSGLAVPLAFGENNVKSRVVNILRYKKPAFWVSVLAVVSAAALGFCLLSNPREGVGAGPFSEPGDDGGMELLTEPDWENGYYTGFQEVAEGVGLAPYDGYRAETATQLAALLLSGTETDPQELGKDGIMLTSYLCIRIRDPENPYYVYRYGDRYYMTKPGDYTLELTQDTYDQIRNVYLDAAQEYIRGSTLTFHAEGDMAEIARVGIQGYYSAFLGDAVPEELRLLTFTINDITPKAGTPEEFLAAVHWDYDTPENTRWISANGEGARAEDFDGWRWTDCYTEFRFRRVESGASGIYALVGVGTGGGGRGLEPIG